MTRVLAMVLTVLTSVSASAQQSASRPTALPDGTMVAVRANASMENLSGYDQIKSQAKGALVAVIVEFTAKGNPQLNFIIGRQADESDFSLIIGGTAYPPVAVGGPVEKLDQVRFAGYQYRTDDGRAGYQTFLSGKKELLPQPVNEHPSWWEGRSLEDPDQMKATPTRSYGAAAEGGR